MSAAPLLARRRWLWPLLGVLVAAALAPAAVAGLPVGLAGVVLAPLAGLAAGVVATPLATRGTSMWPTLPLRSVGLLVAPWVRAPRPGDVVVVADGDRVLGKRLLAVAGETVRSEAGALWVDGRPAAARGCRLPVDLTLLDPGEVHEVRVGPGEVFLVGDHVSSSDSRTHGVFRAADVLGRYVAVAGWGAPEARPPRGPDADDVAALLAVEHPHRAQLAALLAAGGHAPAHLGLLSWWSFSALGQRDRGLAVLERRHLVERDPTDRGTWAHLLSRAYVEDERWDDVARVTADPPADHPFAAVTATRRALACARLRRWPEALAAAESVPEGAVRGAELGPRLAALVALGRVDEAERLADAVTARSGWATAWHAPWYAAYVAVARGELGRGADLVRAALAAGMTDLDAVRTHPLLAPLRADPAWAAVERALAGRPG